MWNRFRVLIGVGVLLVTSLTSVYHLNGDWNKLNNPLVGRAKEVAQIQTKESCLKSVLPIDGVIGFVADEKGTLDANAIGQNIDTLSRFYLTQYILTPLVIEPTLAHEYLVSSSGTHISPEQFAKSLDLIILIDCGSGSAVYKHNR